MASFLEDAMRSAVSRLIARNRQAFPNDETAAAQASLREAGKLGFGDAQPAKACLEQFLRNDPTKWEFELGDLFAQDKSARERVYSETIRRTAQLLTDRERNSINGFGVYAPKILEQKIKAAIDPIISVMQHNYAHEGWWGALGNFGVKVEVTDVSARNKRVAVRLSGEGVYKWAADQARVTQELHKLAQWLIDNKKACEFPQIAKPRTFVVSLADKTLLDADTGVSLGRLGDDHSRQINPSNSFDRLRKQAARYMFDD